MLCKQDMVQALGPLQLSPGQNTRGGNEHDAKEVAFQDDLRIAGILRRVNIFWNK